MNEDNRRGYRRSNHSQNNELAKTLRGIKKEICCLAEALTGQGACCPETNTLLEEIRDILNEARFDFEILCSPDDGSLVIAKFDKESGALIYTTDGVTPYTGSTPVACSDRDLESDPIDYCADGVAYVKWVVKDNGEPTGTVFWTDSSDAIVPAPVDAIKGKCEVCECEGSDYFTTATADGTITLPFEATKINITPNGKCCEAVITFKGPNYAGTPITIRSGRAYCFSKACPLIDEIEITSLNCPDGLDIYAEVETETCN